MCYCGNRAEIRSDAEMGFFLYPLFFVFLSGRNFARDEVKMRRKEKKWCDKSAATFCLQHSKCSPGRMPSQSYRVVGIDKVNYYAEHEFSLFLQDF